MKPIARTLLWFAAFAATLTAAQNNNLPKVQHVIIVVQENRSPENLFNQDATLVAKNAHVQPSGNAGLCNVPGHASVALSSTPLFTCWDPMHNHAGTYPSWTQTWDGGKMDGACGNKIADSAMNCSAPSCIVSANNPYYETCSYSYVDNSTGILDPYFTLANQFGFANYMFQTNQGPSFPAHQFLFSGTSAPVPYLDPNNSCDTAPNEKCWEWFDAENVTEPSGDTNQQANSGCIADEFNNTTAYAWLIDPTSTETTLYTPPGSTVNFRGFPCYSHPTLATLLDGANLTWKYYARRAGDLWTAPTASYDLCLPSGPEGSCTNQEWKDNVGSVLLNQGNYKNDFAPILTDIENCNLASVSWVIPDGNWSDHAGGDPTKTTGDGGPSWVANIYNAVGAGSKCDNEVGYWADTVILVVWDDWGGYYDDVVPPGCQTNPCTGYSNSTGQQYVYGFRVPLLVISAFAKPGYISGANVFPPDCTQNTYCHDFGSILNFIEYAFGQNGHPLGGGFGIGGQNYPYADALVMDMSPPQNPYSLYDFFNFNQSPTPFQAITTKYGANCFHHPSDPNCFSTYPLDPDNDASESD